jgi:hypothetical protein
MSEEFTAVAAVSVRDRIRGKVLGTGRTTSKLIEWEGEKVLVKQPSGRAFEAVSAVESPFRKNLLLLIACAFEADANGCAVRPLFEDTDLDSLLELPPQDPFLSALQTALTDMTQIKKLEVDARKSP